MKHIWIYAILLIPQPLYANEEEEIRSFTAEFFDAYSDSSKTATEIAGKHFAKTPIFVIGEAPALSRDPQVAEKMIKGFRDAFDVLSHPFASLEIETLVIGKDGSAGVVAAFRRRSPKDNDFCNIFSLAKLNGEWKIMTWYQYGLGAQDCSHQH